MTRIFHTIIFVKMDSISGCDIRLVFTFPPKDSTLQYKKCVHLWNNFPCISTLGITIFAWSVSQNYACSPLHCNSSIMSLPLVHSYSVIYIYIQEYIQEYRGDYVG